jgi:hypothetical protein
MTEKHLHEEINLLRDKLTTAEHKIVLLQQELKSVYPNMKMYCDAQIQELEEYFNNV